MNYIVNILETLTLEPRDPFLIVAATGLFFVFWRSMNVVFFRKYMVFFDEREQLTAAADQNVGQVVSEVEMIEQSIALEIARVRAEAINQRDREITQLKASVRENLEKVQSQKQVEYDSSIAQLSSAMQANDDLYSNLSKEEMVNTLYESITK